MPPATFWLILGMHSLLKVPSMGFEGQSTPIYPLGVAHQGLILALAGFDAGNQSPLA